MKTKKSNRQSPELILIEITADEFKQIPIKLRRRLSRRWCKSQKFAEMMDGDQ